MCTAFGSWNHLNRVIHHDTWQRKYSEGCVMAKCCGQVALAQYHDDSDYYCEQPTESDFFAVEPWPEVQQHPRTSVARFHQCQCELRDRLTKRSIKKPTDLRISDPDIGYYLNELYCGTLPRACDGNHQHLEGRRASEAQLWPWKMVERLCWGIMRLLHKRKWQQSSSMGRGGPFRQTQESSFQPGH